MQSCKNTKFVNAEPMKEAAYYTKLSGGRTRCDLCPHYCLLNEGERGICNARSNRGGIFVSDNYGVVTALCADPIEKKPLYHFFPGSQILSVGSFGCNLKCDWCQNASIAQQGREAFSHIRFTPPDEIVRTAANSNSIGLAYTYNEPVVWHEYMMEMAEGIRQLGLKNVLVTNLQINPKPLQQLIPLLDAINADLKSFDASFYKKDAGGHLDVIKKNLKTIVESGVHLEVTFLVLPLMNTKQAMFADMVNWIADELGDHTVLHLSRYFPANRMDDPPTSLDLMHKLYNAAKDKLPYVYLGNVRGNSQTASTFCRSCSKIVIERSGYHTETVGLNPDGSCIHCREPICMTH